MEEFKKWMEVYDGDVGLVMQISENEGMWMACSELRGILMSGDKYEFNMTK